MAVSPHTGGNLLSQIVLSKRNKQLSARSVSQQRVKPFNRERYSTDIGGGLISPATPEKKLENTMSATMLDFV